MCVVQVIEPDKVHSIRYEKVGGMNGWDNSSHSSWRRLDINLTRYNYLFPLAPVLPHLLLYTSSSTPSSPSSATPSRAPPFTPRALPATISSRSSSTTIVPPPLRLEHAVKVALGLLLGPLALLAVVVKAKAVVIILVVGAVRGVLVAGALLLEVTRAGGLRAYVGGVNAAFVRGVDGGLSEGCWLR
jgi:hypothetical protein